MGIKSGGVTEVALKVVQQGITERQSNAVPVEPRLQTESKLTQSIALVAKGAEAVTQEATKVSIRVARSVDPLRDPKKADKLAENIAGEVGKLDDKEAASVHNLTSSAAAKA